MNSNQEQNKKSSPRVHADSGGKTCPSCGLTHPEIPKDARAWKDFIEGKIFGYFFECKCGSTLFSRIEE